VAVSAAVLAVVVVVGQQISMLARPTRSSPVVAVAVAVAPLLKGLVETAMEVTAILSVRMVGAVAGAG
jgi:hypothetical protein